MKIPVKPILFVFISLLVIMITIFYVISPEIRQKIGKPLNFGEVLQTAIIRQSPPVILSHSGGLGNQFFQYAAAYSVAKKRNSDLYVCVEENQDTVNIKIPAYTAGDRKFSLNKFNTHQDKLLFLHPPTNSQRHDNLDCTMDYYVNDTKVEHYYASEEAVFAGELPDDKVIRLGSYFESEVFFASYKSDILNLYQPTFDTSPIEHLKSFISSITNSVSVHIRRGDFSRNEDLRLISLSYQRAAMQLIKQKLNTNNVTFFVFTDDLNYAKKNLDDGQNRIVYMSDFTEDNTLYDFVLMSLCKHNIITNSTFSWWAAYLNKNLHKIVVAPMPKYRPEWIEKHAPTDYNKKLITDLAYPKGWLRIAPTFSNYSDHE